MNATVTIAIGDLVSKFSWVIILEDEEYRLLVISFGTTCHTGNSDAVNIEKINYYIKLWRLIPQ